ncbi:MAG: hypothetical protein J6S21_00205, partial [Victivallales bacterium]|nr:hypothetical protein [Victivallales bacterium]
DLLSEEHKAELRFAYPDALPVSVLTGEGLPRLVARITEQVKAVMPRRVFVLPHSAYREMTQIRRFCFIEREEYLDDGVHLTASVPISHLEHWKEYMVESGGQG